MWIAFHNLYLCLMFACRQRICQSDYLAYELLLVSNPVKEMINSIHALPYLMLFLVKTTV